MALSLRELFLVLRARDEASRVVRSFSNNLNGLNRQQQQALERQHAIGTALTSIGTTLALAGAAGIAFFVGSTKSAVEYQRQVALTLTQVDKQKTSIQELGAIGKRVANDVGAPFMEMQSSLYDIFSSMDVSVKESEVLLRAFAKTAVAGQVSIETAGRATIAIMNAFNVPARDVNKVMDFQFQLVRKGVGTYEQFATTIGRSIPSAARAGQSYQALGGMLAYLTRNGLSAAMATASAGRALDAYSNPKTVANLEKFGTTIKSIVGPKGIQQLAKAKGMDPGAFLKSLNINAKDAKGEFRPLVDVVKDLQQAMDGLTRPQRAAALASLFKGAGGTIQARRFFDLVTTNAKEVKDFTDLTKSMYTATGQADLAYRRMADTAAVRTQLLKNRWQIFRVELGEAFLPILVVILGALGKLLGAWNRLNPSTKKFITYAVMIASAMLVIVGVILAAVGMFMVFSAALTAAGVSLGVVAAVIGVVVAVIAVLVVATILVIKHWDAIKKKFLEVVQTLKAELIPAFHAFLDWFGSNIMPIVNDVVNFFISKWGELVQWWSQVWPDIVKVLRFAWEVIKNVFKFGISLIKGLWNVFGQSLVIILQTAWAVIKNVISGAIQIVEGIFQVFISIITGDWSGLWHGLQKIAAGVWSLIQAGIAAFWGTVKALFTLGMNFIKSIFNNGLNQLKGAFGNFGGVVLTVLRTIVDGFLQFAGAIVHMAAMAFGWIPGIGGKLKDADRAFTNFRNSADATMRQMANEMYGLGEQSGLNAASGVASGLSRGSGPVVDAASRLASRVGQTIRNGIRASSPSKVTRELGQYASLGFALGISDHQRMVERNTRLMIGSMTAPPPSILTGPTNRGPVGLAATSGGGKIINLATTINTQEINPRKNAADLGWELTKAV